MLSRSTLSCVRSDLAAPTAALLLALVLVAAPAAAQGVDKEAIMRDPAVKAAVDLCRADRSRLCAWTLPGGGRILRCLVAKADQLSPDCRAGLQRARDSLVAAGLVRPPAPAPAPAAR